MGAPWLMVVVLMELSQGLTGEERVLAREVVPTVEECVIRSEDWMRENKAKWETKTHMPVTICRTQKPVTR